MCLGGWHGGNSVFVVISSFIFKVSLMYLFIYLFIKTRPLCVAKPGLKLVTILLHQPPKYLLELQV